MKHAIISAGLTALGKSRLARLAAPWTRGLGAILMFHHVRPRTSQGFNPFGGLEITPQYLDSILTHIRASGTDILPIDQLAERLRYPIPNKPFVVLTFDDGYRDNAEHALPILQRHAAPFTVFVTTGFADGTAPLWWLDMAEVAARSGSNSMRAYEAIHARFCFMRGDDQAAFVTSLLSEHAIDSRARTARLCLDWEGLNALAKEPLCTIGAHTLTHPLLAHLSVEAAREEMVLSRKILEERLHTPIRHMAYPVGNADVAGRREFDIAIEAGYETAVTTRSGMLFQEHANHLTALPRLSVNGMHQDIDSLDTLLTGLPFYLMSGGKKLRVA